MVLASGQNGNVEETGPVGNQVNAQDINTRANAGRLARRLRSLKGLLTREVNYCNKKVLHFGTLMAATQQQTQMMTEYARDLLDCYARCQAKHVEVEKGFVDLVKLKTETWAEDDDEGLEEFITGIDTESDACYKKVNKVRSDNLEIFERCKTLLAPTKPYTLRQTQATTPSITSGGFKPNADLKPIFLIKDCTLTEFNKSTDTFTTYI